MRDIKYRTFVTETLTEFELTNKPRTFTPHDFMVNYFWFAQNVPQLNLHDIVDYMRFS